MTPEGLLKVIYRVLDAEVGRVTEPTAWLVDVPDAIYVFQKGGPHLAIVIRPANIEIGGLTTEAAHKPLTPLEVAEVLAARSPSRTEQT